MLVHITVKYLSGEFEGTMQTYAFFFHGREGAVAKARDTLDSVMRVLGHEYVIVAEAKQMLEDVVKGGLYWTSSPFVFGA